MILLGRVYDGLMVDVQAVNDKLVRRSENILMRLTGRSREDARDALGRQTAASSLRCCCCMAAISMRRPLP